MSDAALAIVRHSALNGLHLPAIAGRLAVSDAGPRARWIYRGRTADVATAFGATPSTEPCRAAVDRERAALWLGPDEWLLLAPDHDRIPLAAQMRAAVAGKAASLVDVSHRNCGLVIAGPEAARLLNAACPLDLDPSAFPVGMCTRTLFAKAEIVLWRTGATAFHVEVWRSFAPYVVGHLTQASSDVG